MNAIATDEEKVMMLKVWWQKNWKRLLSIIVIFAIVFGGFKYYTQQQLNKTQAASALFTEFFGAHEEGQMDLAATLATQLQKDYSHTPYANTVALMLTHDAVIANNLEKASEQLTWIINQGSPFAKEIARARLAQIKIAQQEPQAALTLLEGIPPHEYQPLHDEVKGDALIALQRYSEARVAYAAALKAYTDMGLESHLLKFKLDALPQT